MKSFFSNRRGLVQLFAVTVLPLSALLVIIVFWSVNMQQQNMRALVGERDQRAIQSAALALESELDKRADAISSLALLANSFSSDSLDSLIREIDDGPSANFDGGIAFFDANGVLIASTDQSLLWETTSPEFATEPLDSYADGKAQFFSPITDPDQGKSFIVISAFSSKSNLIVAGGISIESLAHDTLSASYPIGSNVTVYLVDSNGKLLFVNGVLGPHSLTPDHPGIAEALNGETGTLFVEEGKAEHVVAFSPISTTNWGLITEEEWRAVISTSLQATQMVPLVLAPAFILALIALWFGARQIVQPLQRLESKATSLAWGDFESIMEPVGGISEVQHLQYELTEMARKVQAAQDGLHDYIAAITSAQEEERMRLARELHDDTIQAVIALKQRVQLAQKSVKGSNGRHALNELETLAEQTIENLRRLTRALRPIYLEDLGLVTALDMLVHETNDHLRSPEVKFYKAGKEQRLGHDVELALYRIAQEALNNVVHHSQAKHANLSILFEGDRVQLEVSDDGVGFQMPKSPTDFTPSGHFGLMGIRERADLIGARLEVKTEVGNGTRLSVLLDNI
ncbi:MAG TPA: ATP-binding protein [Anaerolineales bacterium]|nr:ATP-binding protein [Anaerolineales bacterium]